MFFFCFWLLLNFYEIYQPYQLPFYFMICSAFNNDQFFMCEYSNVLTNARFLNVAVGTFCLTLERRKVTTWFY